MSAQKHILLLGTNVGSVDIVRYAQSKGHRVTVADNLGAESGAKKFSDAFVEVSTSDTEALLNYATSNGVDAVLSGVSEHNLRQAIRISETLGTPFYSTSEQWDQFMDKGRFRAYAESFGVPSPETYVAGSRTDAQAQRARIAFPCVVKPVDGSSLKGITICHREDELDDAVGRAFDASISDRIVIEEFVEGHEFTAAYVVVNGVASLSSLDVRLPYAFDGMTTSFPILRVYPPSFADEYVEQCDSSVKRMIENSGLTNACLFVQGIRSADSFAIFEAGLRLAGEAPYRFLETVNGVNPLTHLVDSALGEPSSYDISRDDVWMGGDVCAISSFILSGGTIDEVTDIASALADIPQVLESETRYSKGSTVVPDGTLRQIGARFILRCSDLAELADVISEINHRVDFTSTEGNSMAVKPDVSLLELV
ncbi:ATP-grasp domain-containing protein [Brevibacterium luteolum]|nr:ATP-grasp domain-containing protein [Brevibacterium luteolum]